MNILGTPRSKISYLNRLQQDLTIAKQLDLTEEIKEIANKISTYKNKQKTARKNKKTKKDETNEEDAN